MNILLVATVSYAGMGPYASEIINSLADEANIFFFLVEDERFFFSKNIKSSLRSKGRILKRENGKFNKLFDLLVSPKTIVKQLNAYCKENKIDVIHFITSDTVYYKDILYMSNHYKVCYTVHDLHPHEAQKIFYKMWKHDLAHKRISRIINKIDYLVTNSRNQYEEMIMEYKDKYIFFHEFPSLVSNTVREGNLIPSEIESENSYILFFGRIEKYKGIEFLYNTYLSNLESFKNTKLVIAGSGDIYFPRSENEQDVIFINRYIKDEEITCLFKNAKCVVYPYISASQSGVLSLSCYFQVPILTSDVSFFKHAVKGGIGHTFKARDVEDLKLQLIEIMKMDTGAMQKKQKEYYETFYNKISLSKGLMNIYDTITHNHFK